MADTETTTTDEETTTDTSETTQDGEGTTETTGSDTSTDSGDSTDTDDSSDTDSDTETTVTLEEELIEDLTAELSAADENSFNATLLKSKIKTAIREVRTARKYPSYYTTEQIYADLYAHYSNIRSIAMYDYNMIGIEGQTSSSENNTSRSYVDRSTLFSGVIPLSKV